MPQLPHPSLCDHALRLVLYFDIFRHPLKISELTCLLGTDPSRFFPELVEKNHIQIQGEYVFCVGREDTLTLRKQRSQHASKIWPQAHRTAALLARLPWIEGILVTGALSKQSAAPDGDIDFMLLVQPGRVWTLKSLLQLGRWPLPERLRDLICTNYLLSTDNLVIPEQNFYTAVELATAVPLYGRAACTALLEQNRWAERFIPGFSWSISRAMISPPLPDRPIRPRGTVLEDLNHRLWQRFWGRKYGYLGKDALDRRFKREKGVSTNHLHDFQDYVLNELHSRAHRAGIAAEPT